MEQPLIAVQRIIGEYGSPTDGPMVIFLGGIHGNEPAGIVALQQVLQTLERFRLSFRGKMVGLAGNLSALSQSTRYVEYDLNRIWTEERIQALSLSPTFGEDPSTDHSEQRELFLHLKDYFQQSTAGVYVIDLHTTSAPSAPFSIVLDTLHNRQLALQLPVPMILGMEEHLSGTLINYIDELGYHTLAFESGQHDDPASVEKHIAAIWILLVSIGCLQEQQIPHYRSYVQYLGNAARKYPPIFEVRYRYGILPTEKFHMRPGFENFQPVRKGQVLAENIEGQICCTERGNIFMPLYQSQGNDGFFVIRSVHPFWLKLSKWMRRVRFDKVLPYLPGIRQDRDIPQNLIVNRRIARWYVVELLHLMGYRQKRIERNKLIAIRRKFDLNGPR